MGDPVRILVAMAAAALIAAAALLLCAWPWRSPRPARAQVGSVLGVGLGFVAGCWWLGWRPHWPPGEDQDRLLLVLLPALVLVELVGAARGGLRRLAWPLRLVVAAGAARVLLHDSIYLTDLPGPVAREWTPEQTWLILGGLGAALAVVWTALALLVRRAPGRSVPLAVALSCAGAAVTIMLSGSASGGQLGLPLAAAVAGGVVASLVLGKPPDLNGVLGLSVVGLFALLVAGHFFGSLSAGHAVVLFFGPLLCWLPELPARFRGLARLAWAVVPVAVVLALARLKFVESSTQTSPASKPSAAQKAPDPNEPTLQDILDFRK